MYENHDNKTNTSSKLVILRCTNSPVLLSKLQTRLIQDSIYNILIS